MVVRMGLRVDNKTNKLQERLRFLRDMMGVEHAAFFTFEGREALSNTTARHTQRMQGDCSKPSKVRSQRPVSNVWVPTDC